MDTCTLDRCNSCEHEVICRCLGITETTIVEAITLLNLQTVKEVRIETGAGDGCTACHRRIRKYLEIYSSAEPICSVR